VSSGLRILALLTLGPLLASCHDAMGPSPLPSSTPPQPDVLTLVPAIDALKLGATEALTAVVVSANGSRRTVIASWSSDAPTVAAVDDGGHVLGVSLGKTTVRASFQALSAAQPVRVVPDYQGRWSGEYRVVDCQQLSGNVSICRTGIILPIRTIVTQNGASLTGTLELYSTEWAFLVETGPVEGSIDDAGGLVLAGTTSSVQAEQPGETRVSGWSTSLTDSGDEMTGRFILNRHFRNFFGWQESVEVCKLVKVTRWRS
jgi:Bacterial Ig-like domain (group 2)